MKIYEILKEENIGKIYTDDTIEEEWKVVLYAAIGTDKVTISLETLENEEDIKDNWDLSIQQIVEMDFEELEED